MQFFLKILFYWRNSPDKSKSPCNILLNYPGLRWSGSIAGYLVVDLWYKLHPANFEVSPHIAAVLMTITIHMTLPERVTSITNSGDRNKNL